MIPEETPPPTKHAVSEFMQESVGIRMTLPHAPALRERMPKRRGVATRHEVLQLPLDVS